LYRFVGRLCSALQGPDLADDDDDDDDGDGDGDGDALVKVVLMFAMDEPIYSTTDSAEIAAVFWIIRGVLLLTVYFGLLVLLHVYPPIKDYTICETNCATALILSVVLFRCSGLQADLLSVCKKTRGGTAVQKYSTSIAGSLLF